MAEYDERIRRLHPVPNRSELEQLSPEELAQAMEQALDDMTEDTYDQAVIHAYLDALGATAPMPAAPDVEESSSCRNCCPSPAPLRIPRAPGGGADCCA